MKVNFLYKDEHESLKRKVEDLKKFKKEQENEIEILENLTARSKCDLYVILSDQIEEIWYFGKRVKDKNKLLIITSNIDTSHILNCIEVTKHITYLNNTCRCILERLQKIYDENQQN